MLALGYTKQNIRTADLWLWLRPSLNVTDVVLTQSAAEQVNTNTRSHTEAERRPAAAGGRSVMVAGCTAPTAPRPLSRYCVHCPLSFNIGRGNLIVSSAARIIENCYSMFNGSNNTYEESVRGPASGLTSCHFLWCLPTSILSLCYWSEILVSWCQSLQE